MIHKHPFRHCKRMLLTSFKLKSIILYEKIYDIYSEMGYFCGKDPGKFLIMQMISQKKKSKRFCLEIKRLSCIFCKIFKILLVQPLRS